MKREHIAPVVLVAVVILVLLLPVWSTPVSLPLDKSDIGDMFGVLVALLLIALFQERAIEIFIVAWHGQDEARLASELESADEKMALIDSGRSGLRAAEKTKALRDLAQDTEAAKQKQVELKSQTRRKAVWANVLLSLLISAAGVRVLCNMVAFQDLSELHGLQGALFRVVDVALTAGIIAGGSEGIHKIMRACKQAMDRRAK
jgi:hypothetical protein